MHHWEPGWIVLNVPYKPEFGVATIFIDGDVIVYSLWALAEKNFGISFNIFHLSLLLLT